MFLWSANWWALLNDFVHTGQTYFTYFPSTHSATLPLTFPGTGTISHAALVLPPAAGAESPDENGGLTGEHRGGRIEGVVRTLAGEALLMTDSLSWQCESWMGDGLPAAEFFCTKTDEFSTIQGWLPSEFVTETDDVIEVLEMATKTGLGSWNDELGQLANSRTGGINPAVFSGMTSLCRSLPPLLFS